MVKDTAVNILYCLASPMACFPTHYMLCYVILFLILYLNDVFA